MIEVHVEGRIELGRLNEFDTGVRRYRYYLRARDYVVPRVLHAMSGQMNTIRLVYQYPDVEGYLQHERNSTSDAGYAEAASGMPFADGTLTYTLYRPLEDQAG